MGLEDERKMLTGSGDPKEVRHGGGRGSGPSPPKRPGPRGPASTSLPPRVCGVGRAGSLDPQNPYIDLGQVDD